MPPVDLSSGLIAKPSPVDLSSGLVPKSTQPEPGMLEPHHDWTDPFRGAAAGIVQLVTHPVDTLSQVPSIGATPTPTIYGAPQAQQQAVNAQNKVVTENAANIQQQGQAAKDHPAFTAGQIIGPALLTHGIAKVVPELPSIAGKTATVIGDTAQDAGTGLMNKTVGTLKSDFKRGANPARGYLETGNGPSVSMHSIADKASTALEDTGQKLGTAYQQADATGIKIPVDVVAQEMAKPIQKAMDLETGPGGTGNVAAIHSYIQQFAPAFDKAAQNGGFTPSELFQMKRAIAENTNWSDPAQFNLKAVRQQQTGALSGILSDAVPETRALNQTYQDLTKLQARALERANTGSRPLTAHIYKAGMTAVGALAGGMEGNALMGAAAGTILDTVPAKTTIAAGLFRGGKALSALGDRLTPANGAPMVDVSPNDLGGNGANNKPGNPQGTPPESSNPTTATQKWAALGTQKILAHIGSDSSSGLTPEDVAEAAKSPQGKQLLLQASSLQPGSPIIKDVVDRMGDIKPEMIAKKYEAQGVDSSLYQRGDTITLSKVVVPKEARGQGIGTAFMKDLIDYADANGKRIVLTPSPDFGGSITRLRKFYKDLGFYDNKGRTRDFTTRETMIYSPKK